MKRIPDMVWPLKLWRRIFVPVTAALVLASCAGGLHVPFTTQREYVVEGQLFGARSFLPAEGESVYLTRYASSSNPFANKGRHQLGTVLTGKDGWFHLATPSFDGMMMLETADGGAVAITLGQSNESALISKDYILHSITVSRQPKSK